MQIPVSRYQPGGDIYAKLQSQYGTQAANEVAAAAATNDRDKLAEALNIAAGRGPSDAPQSTWSVFWGQITTDPLAAPLESANNALGTIGASAIIGLFKNPWVLLTVAGVVFYLLGGFTWLRRQIGNA
jgi:hypothetical protein